MSRREQLPREHDQHEIERLRIMAAEERIAERRRRDIEATERETIREVERELEQVDAIERELIGDELTAYRQVHGAAGRPPRRGFNDGKRGTRA